MDRFLYPFVTGADGKRYMCQFRQKFNDESNNTIYRFLNESSGDTYAIRKIDDHWVFVDGNAYLEHWIEELGDYVDKVGL